MTPGAAAAPDAPVTAPAAIERVREYWNQRPCNIRHSPEPVGTREYFDQVEARKYFVEPHIPAFAQFERWRGKRVLEIGCGIGTDSVNFARAGADLTAIDVSDESVAISCRRFELFGLEGRFFQGNAERLTEVVPVQKYDLIYSFGVIHHTPDPGAVLQQLMSYCKPDTEIRLMLYSRWSYKVLWILLRYGHGAIWRLDELIRQHSEAQTGCPVTYCYSFGELRRLLSDYRIESITKDHIFPYRIDSYVRYQYERAWQFRLLPPPLFRKLERLLGWHALLVARPGPWARP